jgi:hypothetical protein
MFLQRHAAAADPADLQTYRAFYVCICSGVIALVGTLGYILSFAIGAGPVTGLIVPEINKEAVRGETGVLLQLPAVPALGACDTWPSTRFWRSQAKSTDELTAATFHQPVALTDFDSQQPPSASAADRHVRRCRC